MVNKNNCFCLSLLSIPGSYTVFNCHISLVFFDLEQVPHSFFFSDLDIFEDYRPFILWNVLQFGFDWCFFTFKFRLCISAGIPQKQCCTHLSVSYLDAWCLYVPLLITLTLKTWQFWCFHCKNSILSISD